MSGAETGAFGFAAPGRQCLFGVTILLVEDSRSASEAIRLMAAESGARVRRADSLGAALRHLAIYRPSVLIVDLGLPDGDGLELIREIASASTPIRAIVATSGQDPSDWEAAARAAGAASCLRKPIESLGAFQDCLLGILPDRGGKPSAQGLTVEASATVRAAFDDDLRRAHAILGDALRLRDAGTVSYAARFLISVVAPRDEAAIGLAARKAVEALDGGAGAAAGEPLLALLDRRAAQAGLHGAA